jgi:hypothetical protein
MADTHIKYLETPKYGPSDIKINRLVYNAIRTPDGTVLESITVHDYKTYTDANGETYMVDGGLDYLRRNHNPKAPAEDISLYDDAPHEQVRKLLKWGTYGVDGSQPLEYISICDMTLDHINACITNIPHMNPTIRDRMVLELEWREQL